MFSPLAIVICWIWEIQKNKKIKILSLPLPVYNVYHCQSEVEILEIKEAPSGYRLTDLTSSQSRDFSPDHNQKVINYKHLALRAAQIHIITNINTFS